MLEGKSAENQTDQVMLKRKNKRSSDVLLSWSVSYEEWRDDVESPMKLIKTGNELCRIRIHRCMSSTIVSVFLSLKAAR